MMPAPFLMTVRATRFRTDTAAAARIDNLHSGESDVVAVRCARASRPPGGEGGNGGGDSSVERQRWLGPFVRFGIAFRAFGNFRHLLIQIRNGEHRLPGFGVAHRLGQQPGFLSPVPPVPRAELHRNTLPSLLFEVSLSGNWRSHNQPPVVPVASNAPSASVSTATNVGVSNRMFFKFI